MTLHKILLRVWAVSLLTLTYASPQEHLPLPARLTVTPKELELISANFTDFDGSSRVGHISKRFVYTCSQVDMATVSAAYNQASKMIDAAILATNGIVAILTDIGQAYQVYKENPLIKVQWETFAAIFGGVQYPKDAKDKDNQLKMLAYATYIQNVFKTLRASVDSPESLNIDFQCSDTWLSPTDPDGKRHPTSSTNYWDSRPNMQSRTNMALDGWIDIGGDPGCSSTGVGGSTTGFTMTQLWAAKTDVITFCQTFFTAWNSQQASGGTLGDVCSTAQATGRRIQDVIDNDKLAVTVLHELTHSVSAVKDWMTDPKYFNKVSPITDQKCPSNPKVDAYGWLCVLQLADTPDLAVRNADSYALFAAAVYCNKNNWATGFARPVS